MPSPPVPAAGLAEDLPALCAHLEDPLRVRRRLRSTNLLERSPVEVERRTGEQRVTLLSDPDVRLGLALATSSRPGAVH